MRAVRRKSRFLSALLAAGAIATLAYAFTATNTVPASSAGSGSGYTVSAVAYTLNATTPSDIDSMAFTLSANATTAKIVSGSTTYTDCTITGGVNSRATSARTSQSRRPTSFR